MPCTQGISAVTVPLVYVYGEERFINITCAVCCYSWQAVKLPQPGIQWAGNSGRMWRSWRCSYLPWTVNRRERKRYGERGIDRRCYEFSRIMQLKCNLENLRLLIMGGKSHYQSCASLSHFLIRHICKIYTVMAKNVGTFAILSENATFLSENYYNCKCVQVFTCLLFLFALQQHKEREEKSNLIKCTISSRGLQPMAL